MQHQRRYYLFFSWVLLLSNIAIAQTSSRSRVRLTLSCLARHAQRTGKKGSETPD